MDKPDNDPRPTSAPAPAATPERAGSTTPGPAGTAAPGTAAPGTAAAATPGPASFDKPAVPPGPAATSRPGAAGAGLPGSGRPPWTGVSAGYPVAPPRPTNAMAITALVVALVSLSTCPVVGAVAVYLGNRARTEIRSSGENGDGLALAGVIIGWCAVAISVLLLLFMVAYLGFFAFVFGMLAAAPAA